MIRVLVVEDSPVIREFLVEILRSDPEISVIGTATNGQEALEAVQLKKPDLVTMDIHMPRIDGLEATRRIMETCPTPIVIVSGSYRAEELAPTFRALEAGALAFVERPLGLGHPKHAASAASLIETVKLMSEVRVVRRWARKRHSELASTIEFSGAPTEKSRGEELVVSDFHVVAVGASTGGPLVLQKILQGLGDGFGLPLVVVQHMAPGFLPGFVDWLGQATGIPVNLATHGQVLRAGHCYVAPDDFHLRVEKGGCLTLSKDFPEHGLRPSISKLFRSVANTFGRHAVGVLLTGMGKDGAQELKLMREKGALTIVQDRESSVVYGMPGEAVRLSAHTYVLTPEKISALLAKVSNSSQFTARPPN